MRKRIDAYFEIVLRNVKDSVPKAIGYFLVKKSQEVLQFELYNQVNSNQQLAAALGEPARITERRNALTERGYEYPKKLTKGVTEGSRVS